MSDPLDVLRTAQALFPDLPDVEERVDYDDVCNGGRNTNPNIHFCTSVNMIYVSEGFSARAEAAYEMAHVLGHAIQVRHGVADAALRAISSRRDEEDALRGMVTRQVDCVAGVLMAQAGLPAFDIAALPSEPFTDAHWGRRPVNSGPRVSIGTAARAQWYDTGYAAGDFAACTVGEMSSDLIVQALR